MPGTSKAGNNVFGASRIEVWFSTVQVFGQKAEFPEELTGVEWIYRWGSRIPAASTEGLYKAGDVAMTFDYAAWQKDVLPILPSNGMGDVSFNVTLYNGNPALGYYKKVGYNCRIVKLKDAYEMNGGAVMIDVGLICQYWEIDGKTLATVDGTGVDGPSGAIGFEAVAGVSAGLNF